jgi:hypothetical protein
MTNSLVGGNHDEQYRKIIRSSSVQNYSKFSPARSKMLSKNALVLCFIIHNCCSVHTELLLFSLAFSSYAPPSSLDEKRANEARHAACNLSHEQKLFGENKNFPSDIHRMLNFMMIEQKAAAAQAQIW